jgi:uncharacterized protein YijF (DUF1287 family)
MRTNKTTVWGFALLLLLLFSVACRQDSGRTDAGRIRPLGPNFPPALKQVVEAGLEQTKYTFYYDPSYTRISYPGGDVPLERGVCTDVIIRAFRKSGVDLQRGVHEDMQRSFVAYPTKWGLKKPDSNIDHRRVPNLQTYFERKGKALRVNDDPADYLPGDVVTWDLNGLDHIGMVTNIWSDTDRQYMIVHNIGGGAKVQNVLFAWPITGHYRYF